MDLRKLIRDIPDHPKPGILFFDITPLLGDPDGFRQAVDALAERFAGSGADP
jgi:adenine phosphoribosyltransferase